MEGVSFAACGEANDLKLAPTTGGNARPVFALSVQPTAAMSPRIGGLGSKALGAPSMKINAKLPS